MTLADINPYEIGLDKNAAADLAYVRHSAQQRRRLSG